MRNVINEASACTVRISLFDEDDTDVVPTTLRYRLTDVTNKRTLIDWTVLTPSETVDITIPASKNAIYNDENPYQDHALTFEANYDTDAQYADEFRYAVKNLSGFQ